MTAPVPAGPPSGGAWKRVSLDLSEIVLDDVPSELIDLDASLERFRAQEPEKAHRGAAVLCWVDHGASLVGHGHIGGDGLPPLGYARAWLFQDLKQGPTNSLNS